MATLSEEAVAAIRSISPNFLESASNCDVEAMTAFHAEGAVRIEPGIGPALQGRDAILASFENAPCTNMDFTVEPVRVEGRGDLAYAWS